MFASVLLFGCISHLVDCASNSDMKIVVATATVVGDKCVYKDKTFSSIFVPDAPVCEQWTCDKKRGTVNILGCSDPSPGCTRIASGGAKFPDCCSTTCVSTSNPACEAEDGILVYEGHTYNSSKPCVQYACNNGQITKTRCPGADDPLCQSSFADPEQPFPGCCGAAHVCTSNTGRK
uniref:Single domain-containing protein n=1 Tax=Amblyomma maculatum TaxID=34609 RepID=G3MS43_AMBMU